MSPTAATSAHEAGAEKPDTQDAGARESGVRGSGAREAGARESSVRGRGHRPAPRHTHPDQVALTTALAALADPVRLYLVRELARSADWERTCGSFDVPVGKAALSHHFAVLREAGLIEQRDAGTKRANRLRRAEFDCRFPGLLAAILGERAQPQQGTEA